MWNSHGYIFNILHGMFNNLLAWASLIKFFNKFICVKLCSTRVKTHFFKSNNFWLLHILRKFLWILVVQNSRARKWLRDYRILNRRSLQIRHILVIKFELRYWHLVHSFSLGRRADSLLAGYVTSKWPAYSHHLLLILTYGIPGRCSLLNLLGSAGCGLSFALLDERLWLPVVGLITLSLLSSSSFCLFPSIGCLLQMIWSICCEVICLMRITLLARLVSHDYVFSGAAPRSTLICLSLVLDSPLVFL